MSKTKKLLASFLAILIVLTMLPISAVATDSQTTEVEQYTDSGWTAISTPDAFRKMSATGNYYLTGNIDFSALDAEDGKEDGVYTVAYFLSDFNGVLDGCGYTLSGFAIEATTSGGIFAKAATSQNVIIKNLNIGTADTKIKATVNGSSETNADRNFGFLVAAMGSASYTLTLEDVHVYGDCTVSGSSYSGKGLRVGGLVGYTREISVLESSFEGKIALSEGVAATGGIYVGGLCGILSAYAGNGNHRGNAFKNCCVNAEIKSAGYTGGLIGYSQASAVVDGCVVDGTYSSDSYVGGIVGCVSADATINASYANTVLFVATDCATDATLSGTQSGAVYGYKNSAGNDERIYVRGCTDQNTLSRNINGENSFDSEFDPSYRYVWIIDSADDFDYIGEEITYGDNQSYTYATDGFYRLANEIDMSGETHENAVVDINFSGVFDGNGNTVNGLAIDGNGLSVGFFTSISELTNGDDSAILDVSFGTLSSPTIYTGGSTTDGENGFAGIVAGTAGNDSTMKYSAVFNNVNVYANATIDRNTGDQFNFGGFVGKADYVKYFDCSVYGSIVSASDIKFDHRTHIGGFVGLGGSNHKKVFYNCNNLADICINSSSNQRIDIGAIIGNTNGNNVLLNCNSFGAIECLGNTSNAELAVGGLLGASYASAYIFNCNVFGTISATGSGAAGSYAGEFVAYDTDTTNSVNISDSIFYRTTVGTECSSISANMLNCKKDTVITMKEGASVRLSADTGLRFEATVSTTAIERIEHIFGENTVSRGILIAPKTFVDSAGGYTHKDLDAYYKNIFEEGQKAYIEIISDSWFKGNEGDIAGSITGLPANNYDTEFVGVGFLAISVGGNESVKLYAANAQTRDICYVAKKALDDTSVTYGEVINGYTYNNAIEVGETYYEDGNARVFTSDDTPVYSCYSKPQRNILNNIINDTK